MSEKVREILKTISEDSQLLRQLRESPEELIDRFDLSPADLERLKHSYQLTALVENPLIEPSATFTLHTITITGTPPRVLPQALNDLSPERLIEVTKRILTDPAYAARVKAFLGL